MLLSESLHLYDHQIEAIEKMHNGCILDGGVGSGKSRTALAYYLLKIDEFEETKLYIITTARKRDTKEWEGDAKALKMDMSNIVIDSWNNIQKYIDIKDAFVIFDEQRAVGSGAWSKAFIKITKNNKWIMLSATPGDCWGDYIPVFIANGFYKNRTEFSREHVVYNHYFKYPKVDHYVNQKKLRELKSKVIVNMDFERPTKSHIRYVKVSFDQELYKMTMKNRWDYFANEPIQEISKLCSLLRRITNGDESRLLAVAQIFEEHPKLIIFYNFDYELDMLKRLCNDCSIQYAEWNGHSHQSIPKGEEWIYLVQYTAGAEGWNCIDTDTILFYSQSYSYKATVQAAGRIDRMNTPFTDLYYYYLISDSNIDRAIRKAIHNKKDFNENRFIS